MIVLLCMLIIKKDILVPGEGPTQGLDNTMITAEAKYPINFTRPAREFMVSLDYNGSSSILFVHAEIKPYTLRLGNISIDLTIDNINMKKTGLKWYVNGLPVDYNIIDTNIILDVHKYLMNITCKMKCLDLSKKCLWEY